MHYTMFHKYLAGSMAYGLARNVLYKKYVVMETEPKLYLDQALHSVVNSFGHIYIIPFAVYEDLCNMERYVRNIPIMYPSTLRLLD